MSYWVIYYIWLCTYAVTTETNYDQTWPIYFLNDQIWPIYFLNGIRFKTARGTVFSSLIIIIIILLDVTLVILDVWHSWFLSCGKFVILDVSYEVRDSWYVVSSWFLINHMCIARDSWRVTFVILDSILIQNIIWVPMAGTGTGTFQFCNLAWGHEEETKRWTIFVQKKIIVFLDVTFVILDVTYRKFS